MSYTLDIIAVPIPEDDSSAWQCHSGLRRRYFDDERPPVPGLRKLHDILTARYQCLSRYAPDDDAIADCVWSDGPLINNFCGDMAALGIASSAAMGQVHAFIVTSARALQLTVFDPQSGRIFRPAPPAAHSTYSIAIEGVMNGFALDQVVAVLARMVKRDEGQIRVLLATPGTVVKSGVDHGTAEKYRVALSKIGCQCAITPEAGSAAADPLAESPQQILARLEALAGSGDAQAKFDFGMALAGAKDVVDHERLAAEWIEKAAEQGHHTAAYMIASFYYHGEGVLQNYAAAFYWAKVSAEKGNAHAQYFLSGLYREGQGTRPDAAQADQWLTKASEQGHPGAQHGQGLKCLSEGDPAKAAFWFQKAADQGSAMALADLGVLYAKGQGVTRDLARAMTYLAQAAAEGVAAAQYNLAEAFAKGDGITPDDAQALIWYGKAAAQGYPAAEYEMSMRYRFGAGVETDITESIDWLQYAAVHGHADAQFFLGGLHAKGDGMPVDEHLYMYWLKRAAQQGHAEALDILRMLEGR